ncbi:MAG: hypothetical protein RL685_968 [Pseudomonadota bacterium]|jgi:hypothetical protein
MAEWSPPHGFTGRVHHLEAKVRGAYRASQRAPAFGGRPQRRG